jgi:hypothetical protein
MSLDLTGKPQNVGPLTVADKLTATVVVSHEVTACSRCRALKQKLEDTEGALEGAQNIIRQLRDANSGMVA